LFLNFDIVSNGGGAQLFAQAQPQAVSKVAVSRIEVRLFAYTATGIACLRCGTLCREMKYSLSRDEVLFTER
jgi:hypothetical protein